MTCPITDNNIAVLLAMLAVAMIGFILGRLSARRRSGGGESGSGFGTAGAGSTGEGIELYVGNLPYKTSDRELARMFEKYGKVLSVRLIKNKGNGRSRGYGFVEMAGQDGADKAVSAMSGTEINGRKLVVNEAKSQSRD